MVGSPNAIKNVVRVGFSSPNAIKQIRGSRYQLIKARRLIDVIMDLFWYYPTILVLPWHCFWDLHVIYSLLPTFHHVFLLPSAANNRLTSLTSRNIRCARRLSLNCYSSYSGLLPWDDMALTLWFMLFCYVAFSWFCSIDLLMFMLLVLVQVFCVISDSYFARVLCFQFTPFCSYLMKSAITCGPFICFAMMTTATIIGFRGLGSRLHVTMFYGWQPEP
jgi:hypothetical protein